MRRRRCARRRRRSAVVERAPAAPPRRRLAHAHLRRRRDAELRQQRARSCRRRGGRASAVCCSGGDAAHQRIGEVDRHVGDALDAAAAARAPASPAARAAFDKRARDIAARRAPRRAPASTVSNSKPGRPSRLPSTRSTFQAGRASPSGLTTPWKLCTRPSALTKVPAVSVNGAIGSSTSAYVERGRCGTASARRPCSACSQRGARRAPVGASRTPARR